MSIKTESAQYQQFTRLMTRGYQSITAGLDIDESKGPKTSIIQFYRNGIMDLESALTIRLTCAEEQQIAELQRQKMLRTISQVQARLNELLHEEKAANGIRSIPMKQVGSPILSKSTETSGTNLSAPKPKSYSKQVEEFGHQILDEILIVKPNVTWDDIAGLDTAKKALHEIVVLPYLRPDLFTGLRTPARGVLLFGPPVIIIVTKGTGKTMLAKAVASESKAKFFAISASTLTSKYFGEGEKLVKALFSMARELQPSIIFIDEIDSILSERSESEHEASRRLKTEFLLQFDGIASGSDDRILILAATNRPQELDQAALRRLVKRIYIPLPEYATRLSLIQYLLRSCQHSLSSSDISLLAQKTQGYSSSDLTGLAREASLGPIRSLGSNLLTTPSDKVRPLKLIDFTDAMKTIRPSVSTDYVNDIVTWNKEKGVSGL